MGFSLSATTAIIGVAVLMSIEIIVSTTVPTVTDVNNAYDEMKTRSIEQIQTDVNITNVRTIANGSDYDLYFDLTNTGSTTLETLNFNIMINGTIYSSFNCSKDYVHPENSVTYSIDNLNGEGIRRLKIVTDNGISDYYTYVIT